MLVVLVHEGVVLIGVYGGSGSKLDVFFFLLYNSSSYYITLEV